MFVGPVEGDGAAALQNHDERLAGGGHGFQQLLLRRGQVDAGAVAAFEAVDLDPHLFAFELWRKADKSNYDIGFFGPGHGLVKLGLGRRFPLESEAAAGLVAGVRVFQAEAVRVGVSEIHRDGRLLGELHHRRGGGRCSGYGFEVAHRGKVVALAQAALRENLAVEDEAVGFGGRPGETVAGFKGKDIVAGGGNGERAGPAYGVVVRGQLGHGQHVFPVGLDLRLGNGCHRAAGPVGGSEEFGGQALA